MFSLASFFPLIFIACPISLTELFPLFPCCLKPEAQITSGLAVLVWKHGLAWIQGLHNTVTFRSISLAVHSRFGFFFSFSFSCILSSLQIFYHLLMEQGTSAFLTDLSSIV